MSKMSQSKFSWFFPFIWDTGDPLSFRPYSLCNGLNFIKRVMRAFLYLGECYGKKWKR